MIGKHCEQKKGAKSSFYYLNQYILSGDKTAGDKVAYANCTNINFCDETNLKYAATAMTLLASENKYVKKPVKHFLLSWREGEIPTKEQIDESVQIVLKELGMEGCQCLYGLHKNTDNYHLHISINSVHPITKKAIQPNNNLTWKAIRRAARKIEKLQGWELEKGANASEIDENGYTYDTKSYLSKKDDKVPQASRDKEIRTGEKSAIRIAQETILPLIKEATSWQQVHYRLGVKGCEYIPKGSGAVIKVGDTIIKASTISKQCSMKNMEKKFGPFIPRKETGAQINKQLEDKHIEEPIKEAKGNELWIEYTKARKEYNDRKKKARQDMNLAIKEERNKLYEKQKKDRQESLSGNWKKMGKILNLMRSQVAQWQAKEKQELNEIIDEERKKFNKKYAAFPNFEDWLKDRELYDDAEIWRYKKEYTYDPNLISGYPDKYIKPEAQDIRSYRAITDYETGYVNFVDELRPGKIAFTDRGKSIKIEMTDEKTLIAGLQLAQQKWGGVKLTGTDDYKNKCIELAAKYNIRISNPELQDKVKLAKEKEEKLRKEAPIQKQLDGFRRYMIAVQPEHIKVTATQYFKDGGRRGFMVNDKDGYPDGYDPQSLEDHMNRIVSLQRSGRNIYYTPISEKKYHILVDDLSPETLGELYMDGFKPAIVCKTSPNNFQAVLCVDKPGTEYDHEIGNRLTKMLNKRYGDPKVSGEIHAHRAPGFDNKKLKHKQEDGSYPEIEIIEDKGGKCPTCKEIIREIYADIVKEENEKPKINITQTVESDTEAAYLAHLKNIIEMQKRKGEDPKNMDASRIDSMVTVRLRATGHPYEKVVSAVEHLAPKTREILGSKGTHNWPDYAERTADWAFGLRGDMQLSKFEAIIPKWKKIEKIDLDFRKKISEREQKTADNIR